MVPKRVLFGEPTIKRGTFRPRWLTESPRGESLRGFSISCCYQRLRRLFGAPARFSSSREIIWGANQTMMVLFAPQRNTPKLSNSPFNNPSPVNNRVSTAPQVKPSSNYAQDVPKKEAAFVSPPLENYEIPGSLTSLATFFA